MVRGTLNNPQLEFCLKDRMGLLTFRDRGFEEWFIGNFGGPGEK